MVEKHVVVICVAASALALAAAVLGIVGEATKSRSFVRYDGVNCVYRRTPAFDCGIAAAASLLTGQAILTAATGCWDGCRRRSPSDHRRFGGYFASVLSWYGTYRSMAFLCSAALKKVWRAACRFLAILSACAFLAGAVRNERGERRPKEGVASYYQCTVLVAGVFAGASFLSLAAAAVGIASYIATEGAASSVVSPPAEHRVVLGQPQQL
ncbi:hypothetical protein D1007_22245 [Hordeum vulgare]|nr:hypothetical protein D1007_22245 [Hordeum vulgare]